ncbi:hypothetical protein QUA86_31990 [Microcoleus sp. F6_B6]
MPITIRFNHIYFCKYFKLLIFAVVADVSDPTTPESQADQILRKRSHSPNQTLPV